jgi:hypothetical protein
MRIFLSEWHCQCETGGQSVRDETVKSSSFSFSIAGGSNVRYGVWAGKQITEQQNLGYACTVRTRYEHYELAPSIALPESYPVDVQPCLLPTETIQADSEEIAALFETIVPQTQRDNMTAIITRAYDYCHRACCINNCSFKK